MSWLMETAIANAAVAVALALVVSIASRWVRRPAVRHALWVLVLIKLVTPPLVPIDISVPSSWAGLAGVRALPVSPGVVEVAQDDGAPIDPEPAPALVHALAEDAATVQPAEPSSNADTLMTDRSNDEAVAALPAAIREYPDAVTPARAAGALPQPQSFKEAMWGWLPRVLAAAWLMGGFSWWCLCAYRIICFKRRLVRYGRINPAINRRLAQLAAQFELKHLPQVRVIDDGLAPMLWGCGRWTWIILPQQLLARLDADARDAMLLHELAHFARRDHWVRLLELCVTGLFWWHPVVWWAKRQIAICEEECCDARVVSVFKSPRGYAEVLLETLDFVADFRPMVSPVTSGMSDVPILERRLRQIMAGVTPWSVSRSGRWALGGLVVLLPCNPLLWAAVPHRAAMDRAVQPGRNVPEFVASLDSETLSTAQGSVGNTPSTSAELKHTGAPAPPQPTDHPLLRTGPTRDDWATAASGSGRFRLRAFSGDRVQLHDASTGRSLDLTETGITTAAFLPRDRMLVGTKNGDVRIFDAASAAPVSFLGRHRDVVTAVCVFAGRMAVTGSRDGSVFVWDLMESGAIRYEWKLQQAVSAVRCSPDGKIVAVACGDWLSSRGVAALFDLETGQLLQELETPAAIGAVAFRPDGKTFLTADWNGMVTYWDVHSGVQQGQGRVSKDAVSEANFSSDNDALSRITAVDDESGNRVVEAGIQAKLDNFGY